VLDDRDACRQQLRVSGSLSADGRVDVQRVDADERGAGAREALRGLDVEIHERIDDLASLDGAVVIANELLDNLPFRRVRRNGSAPVDVHIDLVGDRLVEVERPAPDVAPPGEDVPEVVVPTGALAFVDADASRMRRSYALLIDYSTERGHDVHGYRRHRVVEDVLARPGAVDITAGVDLDAVEARARANGLVVLGRVSQRAALLALGFDEWIAADRERRAGSGAGVEARAWAARNRASLLVARDGLGAHRWVLLATPRLPAPRWLVAALEGPSPD